MSIAGNIIEIRSRIDAAARRVSRSPSDITLMAVSKTFPAGDIRQAYAAGLRVFGESRVQEFVTKAESIRDLVGAEFHFIGHLQANKAGKALELFAGVDSVDSLRLARKINEAAARLHRRVPVLIEINVGGEVQKSGIAPGSEELEDMLHAAAGLESLEFRGLMTVPPYTEDPEGARPFFRALGRLREEIAGRNLPGIGLDVLSLGMSNDFEVAIEEGATCVRVGSAIFGERPKP
jgi:pyridoxal phosphate enzyme (YggS family)